MGNNVMREISLSKLTINMGAGDSTPKVENCKKLLEKLTGKKVMVTKTHKRNPFGVAKGRAIGVKVTLRGDEAREFLKNSLQSLENKLKSSQFDSSGNFSFGIHEYFNIPGVKYDPDIGMLGMDVCVTLERKGFRVKKRRIRPGKIGKKHRITSEEAAEWVRKNFGTEIV